MLLGTGLTMVDMCLSLRTRGFAGRIIATSRRVGTSGVILFSYDALTTAPYTASTVTEIGRAAFGSGSD